jgi:CDP-diacylglycerol--glycerol-3-phosphate 3-phosphatidyltransferase
MWYGFVAAVLWYFSFRCKDRGEYWQLIGAAATGMTVFIITSFVYPNGQNLRPVLGEGSLFTQAVRLLYQIDTPTNILPSMHVFMAVACCVAVCRNQECGKHRKLIWSTELLTVLIILSTMLLKQHSVVDVLLALVLYGVCYQLFYRIVPQYAESISGLLTPEQVCTIPNFLSMFRLVLAVLFLGIYQRYGGMAENRMILTGILVLSGITDFLDGKIARKFHMVSDVGKVLDPIADKVTQGVLLLCLLSEYKLTKVIFLLFLIKEGYMAAVGAETVKETKAVHGARWYGKVSTAVFYIVMVMLVVFPDIPEGTANLLLLCCGSFLLLSFIMYARYYHIVQKNVEPKALERA